ncbi:hypothetical protein OQA88_8883 [Cercophora sp. LCS_1]
MLLSPPLAIAYFFLQGYTQAHSIPTVKRQERDFKWALVGYSEPGCRGSIVANWRGSENIPTCIKIDETQSIAGGSGDGTNVNLWEDDECSVPAADLAASGQDSNGYPCYNAVIRSFTVDP